MYHRRQEKEVWEVYRKNVQEWMKHIDFMLIDILSLNLAYVLAYMTRMGLKLPYHEREYLFLIFILTLLDAVILIANETMKNVLRRGYYREAVKTAQHVFLTSTLAIAYLFVIKGSAFYSRIVLVSFAVYYGVVSYCTRLLWKKRLRSSRRTPDTSIYIISSCSRVENVVQRYQGDPSKKFLLTGVCLLDLDQVGQEVCGVPINSNADDVLQYLCRAWVDEVVISVPSDYALPEGLINGLAEMGIVVHIEMEMAAKYGWQTQEVEKIADRMVLTMGMNMVTPKQAFVKRTMDILGGLAGCVITLLLTLIIGPMIYIKSPGPIFFSQVRVGKNGKPFKMYKFRSMYLDAEERKAELVAQNRIGGGLMFKLDYDPRIIGSQQLPDGTVKKGIGNYIRDWSLDEFPQFWNCLKGDISLVGTRPPTMDEWEKYELHHRSRLAIKPGITGMWQVSGRSKITDFEQVVELDRQYIQQWSMGLDFRILLKTVKVVLGRDGSM